MIIHLSLLFINFITFSYSQSNTIHKACAIGGSTCGGDQVCINGLCECDPTHRRFWTGEKHGCRICPSDYTRQPTRCYKYYPTAKTHSEARADCRRNQADLFSWRDNTDENELLIASTRDWGYNYQTVTHQFYAWSGGIVHHGRGSKAEYKITWFDPKGPTLRHPEFNDPLNERYCNGMMMVNYKGEPEPTRDIKNGETENCVSIVFLPQPGARGYICMADDYCSTKMSYICELTEATLSGNYQTLPPIDITTKVVALQRPSDGNGKTNNDPKNEMETGGLSALNENKKSSATNKLIYVIGGVLVLIIIGAVTFIIIRKQKQNQQNTNVSPTHSIASSNMSGADTYDNA